jgi:L-2-hydroxyglutarate oxidase LhgO
VIHAGIYYRPGSLKAELCVAGARALYQYCAERGIRTERSGKVIVATEEREIAGLEELERRGSANGVPGLRRIGPDELREIEPHARGIAALHSPATGVVDFSEVARALAADLALGGGTVSTGCRVHATSAAGERITISHAARICGCARSGASWSGPASIPSRTPTSRSSACTSPATWRAMCSSGPRR